MTSSGDKVLEWFPKPYGLGDIDGAGLKGLLGTPNVNPAAVVVRETAQNSWDARGSADQINFTLNVRELDSEAIRVLRDRVFVGPAPELGLSRLWKQDSLWALEVSDRGTTGLDGPVRNDVVIAKGVPTNFVDFVLNVGAPRDVHLGGGTYGFGKTAAYRASGVGSVLIWSRILSDQGIESRLIGSAIGSSFEKDSKRYTGRHWWGSLSADGKRIEPVTGELADELGKKLFATPFGRDETGTSLLILDPVLTDGPVEELPKLLIREVRENLWPKLMDEQQGRDRMDIHVQLNGADQRIDPISSDSVLAAYAACLSEIRTVQAGGNKGSGDFGWHIEVKETWSKRPVKLLGHLAMVRFPMSPFQDKPSRSVALMRNEAELVVKYLDRPQIDKDGVQWAGVFKPVAEVDDSFAASEPPAHDDWVPQGMPDRKMKTDVNVAFTRIKEETTRFTRSAARKDEANVPSVSGAVAGSTLAGLLGGIEGTGATTPKSSGKTNTRKGTRASRPRLHITPVEGIAASEPGWLRTGVDVEVRGTEGQHSVEVVPTVGVDGGTDRGENAIKILGWVNENNGYDAEQRYGLSVGAVYRYEFEVREDLVAEVNARIVGPNA